MEEMCFLLQEAEKILENVKQREKELPKDWSARLYRAIDALRNSQERILYDLVHALRKESPCSLGKTPGGNIIVLRYDALELANRRVSLEAILNDGLFYPVAILLIQKVREALLEVPQLATVLEIIGDIVNEKKEQSA